MMLELPSYSYPRNLTYVWNKSKVFAVKRPVYRLVYNRQNMTTTTSLPKHKGKGEIIMINEKIYEIEKNSDAARKVLDGLHLYNIAVEIDRLESELEWEGSLNQNDIEKLFCLRELNKHLNGTSDYEHHYVRILDVDQIVIPSDGFLKFAYADVLHATEKEYQAYEMNRLVELYNTNEAVRSFFNLRNIYTLDDVIKLNKQSIEYPSNKVNLRELKLTALKKRLNNNVLVSLDGTNAFVISNQIHNLYDVVESYLREQTEC